ncbi:MAG: hypothetical protein ACU843_04575 [Gammaproteobacteria bacterium]
MKSRKWCFLIGLWLIWGTSPQAEESQTGPVRKMRLEAGRSFGHLLGDLVHQDIRFSLDRPYRLEQNSLPHPGPLGKWLELREVEATEIASDQETRYRIKLLYQIFPAIRDSEIRQIPGIAFQVYNGSQSLTFHSPESSLTLDPLIPDFIPDSEIRIRAAKKPLPIALTRHLQILTGLGAAALVVLAYFAWRRGLLPFSRSAKLPFSRALKEVARSRRAESVSPEYRSALCVVHRALNETAGETLFAGGLEDFFRAFPAYAPMREKTLVFFKLSQQVFYAQSMPSEAPDCPLRWLEQFCREYRSIERNLP